MCKTRFSCHAIIFRIDRPCLDYSLMRWTSNIPRLSTRRLTMLAPHTLFFFIGPHLSSNWHLFPLCVLDRTLFHIRTAHSTSNEHNRPLHRPRQRHNYPNKFQSSFLSMLFYVFYVIQFVVILGFSYCFFKIPVWRQLCN